MLQPCCNRSRTCLTSFDTTLTPLRAQRPATLSKPEKGKRLRYAGFAIVCNSLQRSFPPLQGGGRWFDSSIAHLEKAAFCRTKVEHEKGDRSYSDPFYTSSTLTGADNDEDLFAPRHEEEGSVVPIHTLLWKMSP
jgi:hypothetical protein